MSRSGQWGLHVLAGLFAAIPILWVADFLHDLLLRSYSAASGGRLIVYGSPGSAFFPLARMVTLLLLISPAASLVSWAYSFRHRRVFDLKPYLVSWFGLLMAAAAGIAIHIGIFTARMREIESTLRAHPEIGGQAMVSADQISFFPWGVGSMALACAIAVACARFAPRTSGDTSG
jgi:hypothetical protein